MSSATSYRFESNCDSTALKKALTRQNERIKLDELTAERTKTVQLEREVNVKAEWNESLQKASECRRMRDEAKTTEQELNIASTAAVRMRREALKRLIEQDNELYKLEFNKMGKTFYVQRL